MKNNLFEYDPALQWSLDYLTSYNNLEIISYQNIVQTSYSKVHKIISTIGDYYLKQTPEALFIESQILTYFNNHGCNNIPELVAENKSLNCFLMKFCGEVSLRHLFNGKIDVDKLALGITNYTKIQRTLENKIQELLELGISDWRLSKFPTLYNDLIQQEVLLINDGLSEKEIQKLNDLNSTCLNLCEALANYKIPETINHCDFHENNMLFNKKTGEIAIIDWGEVVISHPFFSLNSCLWNLTYFQNIKPTDVIYRKIQMLCISPWVDLYDDKKLLEAFNIAYLLHGIFAALGYENLYNATKNSDRKVQLENPGSIAGCLRTFLRSN